MYQDKIAKEYGLALLFIAAILTSINMVHLVKLMTSPTPGTAVSSMGIILVQEVIFVVQAILYYDSMKDEEFVIVLSAFFLFLQAISVVVVYRFWELILFNYDDSTWNDGSQSITDIDGSNFNTFVNRISWSFNRNSTENLKTTARPNQDPHMKSPIHNNL
jgi:hypothetical protein